MFRVACLPHDQLIDKSRSRFSMAMMERWDSCYYYNGYPGTYAGASHVRYQDPMIQGVNLASASAGRGLGDTATQQSVTFTSATDCGAKCWSSSISSNIVDSQDSEAELSPPESPLSLKGQEVCCVKMLVCIK